MIGKSINLFSKEEFFEKIFRRSGSTSSLKIAKVSINWLDKFSLGSFEKDTDVIMDEIRKEMLDNPHDVSAMIYLDKFSTFLQNMDKSSSAVKGYVGFAKKYLRQCGGIRISGEDMEDYVTLPINQDDEELKPLTKKELKLLVENTPNSRRRHST